MAHAMLDCVVCSGRKWQPIEGAQTDELRMTGAMRGFCTVCNRETYWKVADYGRRTGKDRREPLNPLIPDGLTVTERVALRPPPDKESYRQAAAQLAQADRRGGVDRRESFNRAHVRVPLQLPVRVRVNTSTVSFEEITSTRNVSRDGLYFESHYPYSMGMPTKVCLNYSPEDSNLEQAGKVVRISRTPKGTCGVAIQLSSFDA